MAKQFSKAEKIKLLTEYRDQATALKSQHYENNLLSEWQRDTRVAVEKIFDEKHAKEFDDIYYSPRVWMSGDNSAAENRSYQYGLDRAIAQLNSMIKEVELWDDDDAEPILNNKLDVKWALANILIIIDQFDAVAKQLRRRHAERETLDVSDEYDVQDLFHALLKLYFDDIRKEEWTPSYGGSSSRMDFLLDDFGIAIEIKMTRKGLKNKEAGEQLAVDKDHYRSHHKAKQLICFVYDPDGYINNPRGFEKDLRQDGPLKTDIFVRP